MFLFHYSVCEGAGSHAFHHFARTFELFEQTVDIHNACAAAGGNALAAGSIQNGRITTLFRGHGADDGLGMRELLLIDFHVFERGGNDRLAAYGSG